MKKKGKRKKRKRKKKTKKNSTELQKPNEVAGVYDNHKNWLKILIHTDTHTPTNIYTHKQNQNNSTKIKHNRLTKDTGGQRSMTCCSLWGHKELDTN